MHVSTHTWPGRRPKQAARPGFPLNARPCPLCGGLTADKLAEMDYVMFDGCCLERPLCMLVCHDCGLVYNEINDPSSLTRYYTEQAAYGDLDLGSGSGFDSPLDRRRYGRSYEALAPFLAGPETRIIDLGCAKGGFLFYLRDQGFTDLTGVDLSRPCLDHLAAHGFGALFGGAEHIPLPDSSVDMVYSSNLFEHIYDLAAAAREVGRVLRPGGLFLVETPDSMDYDGCCLKGYQWLLPEHINFLSRAHLEELLKLTGFSILGSGPNRLYYSENHYQPQAYALGRKAGTALRVGGRAGHSVAPRPLREQISRRLVEDAGRLAKAKNLVDLLAAEGRSLFLWGLGWTFNFYYAQLDWSRSEIKALVDRRTSIQNCRFGGREVRGLEALAEAGPDDAVLALATHSAGMKAYLAETNCRARFFDLIGGWEAN